MSHNLSPANTNQLQTQAFKKYYGRRQEGHPATGVNAIEIVKKDNIGKLYLGPIHLADPSST